MFSLVHYQNIFNSFFCFFFVFYYWLLTTDCLVLCCSSLRRFQMLCSTRETRRDEKNEEVNSISLILYLLFPRLVHFVEFKMRKSKMCVAQDGRVAIGRRWGRTQKRIRSDIVRTIDWTKILFVFWSSSLVSSPLILITCNEISSGIRGSSWNCNLGWDVRSWWSQY